jgi:hypothetical protein
MQKIEENEEKLSKSNNDTEKHQLQSEIKRDKDKVVDEVNANLGIEFSLTPKFTAQIEMKGIHLSQF